MSHLPEFRTYNGHFITPHLAVGGCPREEDVEDIVTAGVGGILNLVACCGPESFAYVPRLPATVTWHHLGFWDGWLMADAPGYRETLSAGYARFVVQRAAIFLRDHRPLLIHCMSGIGRSGNLLAILLAADEGIMLDEAISRMRERRPQVAGFAHEGFWKAATGEALVRLARQVLDEAETPSTLLRERVRGSVANEALR